MSLADGRVVRLAGMDPVRATAAHPAMASDARRSVTAWLAGQPALLRSFGTGTDRWGRLPALVFARPAGAADPTLSVAAAMIDAGLARARPEPDTHGCWNDLRAAEDGARKAGLGLWGDPYYAVRHADDGSSLAAAMGSLVVVEGRVAHVGETRTHLYLDLGPARGTLAVRVARRDLFILDQLGSRQSDWIGRSIRMRGVLDDRNGPLIDVVDQDQIEVLDGAGSGGTAP